jgi:type I restriction enzyme, S subunit
MVNEIPDGWKNNKIGSLGKIVTGKTPPTKYSDNFGDKYPFITPKDMKGQKYVRITERYLSEKGKDSVKNCCLPQRTICISCIGSDMGKVVMTSQASYSNQQLNCIIPFEISPDFVYYAMLNISYKLRNIAFHSTAVPILNKSDFSELQILEPENISESRTIGYILSVLDEKIESNCKINKLLEAIGEAVFNRWFVNFEFPNEAGKPYKSSGGEMIESKKGNIPKGWEIKRFEEITETIFCGGTPDTRNSEYWDGDYSWLSSGETSSHFIIKTEKKITKKGIENFSTKLAKKGDIVVASAGQGKTRGQTSLCLIDTYVNQSVNVVRSKNSIVPNSYLFLNLSLRYPQLRDISDSFSIRGSLTTRLVKDLEIVLPPLANTCAFDTWFISAVRKIKSNLIENEALSQIRDLLLPKLMSGKIRVTIDNKMERR